MERAMGHYEAAFEDLLRSRGIAYVAVNQARKALLRGVPIKSFDFLVYPSGGDKLLVDVKGRKFPYRHRSGRRSWENWATAEDVTGLRQWESVFGPGHQALLVFAYWLVDGTDAVAELGDVQGHEFNGRWYAFLGVPIAAYQAAMRSRSPKWQTVTVPAKQFREMATPVTSLL